MLFSASAADMNRSRASSDDLLKPGLGPEPLPAKGGGLLFFPPRRGLSCEEEERGIVEEDSSGQESVIVLSLPDSSDLDSVSYALSVFSLSTSVSTAPPRCGGNCL